MDLGVVLAGFSKIKARQLEHVYRVVFSVPSISTFVEPQLGHGAISVVRQPTLSASNCPVLSSMPSSFTAVRISSWSLHALALAICSSVRSISIWQPSGSHANRICAKWINLVWQQMWLPNSIYLLLYKCIHPSIILSHHPSFAVPKPCKRLPRT